MQHRLIGLNVPPLAPGTIIGGTPKYFPDAGDHAVYGFADYVSRRKHSNNRFHELDFYVGDQGGVDLVLTNLMAPRSRNDEERLTPSRTGRTGLGHQQRGLARPGHRSHTHNLPGPAASGRPVYDHPQPGPRWVHPGGPGHTPPAQPDTMMSAPFADWVCGLAESNWNSNLSNAVSLAVAPTTLPDLWVTGLTAQRLPAGGRPADHLHGGGAQLRLRGLRLGPSGHLLRERTH